MTLDRRLQVLIDAERYAILEREAERRGVSVASLVRAALDMTYPVPHAARHAAAQRLLDAEPIAVDEWQVVKEEILAIAGRADDRQPA